MFIIFTLSQGIPELQMNPEYSEDFQNVSELGDVFLLFLTSIDSSTQISYCDSVRYFPNQIPNQFWFQISKHEHNPFYHQQKQQQFIER